jgi:hypothetical protein
MPPRDPAVAKWLASMDPVRDAYDTASMYAGLSLEERGRMVSMLCKSAMQILQWRPDRGAKALEYQAPRSSESEELWRSLVRRAQQAGWKWKPPQP